MSAAILITTRLALFQKPWVISCGLAFAFSASAFAQSAENFAAKSSGAEAPAKQDNAPATDKTVAVAAGPSRYVAETDLAAYVESLASKFSMGARATDPFGQLQDPEAKPIIKPKIAASSRRIAPAQITPFSEIIRHIQVTTIMPGERQFLIGTRTFNQGDHFPMNYRGRSINVEIVAVNSREIQFRNLDSDETESLKLDLLPVGMTPGNGQITAPGMVPDRPNSPLEIEPGN